jgi:DNA-binding protein YbaB
MLDNMKMLGALSGLMKNKDRLRDAGARVKSKMEAAQFTRESGGGAARVRVSGAMKVLEVRLSPALAAGFAQGTASAQASDLVCEALNAALADAQAALKKSVDDEAKALGLDGVLPDVTGLLGG